MRLSFLFISTILVLTSCIGSTTNFSNRGVTYQYAPSIEGKANTLSQQPKVNDTNLSAEKTNDFDTTANTAEQQNLNK